MAGVAKQLFHKLPNQRIASFIGHRHPLPLPLLPTSTFPSAEFDDHNVPVVYPASSCSFVSEFNKNDAIEFYPSFSFGNLLNPYSPSGFCLSQPLKPLDLESDESRTMWADSVKKKRKRKMNKHKLRKLRRRLRGRS